MTSLKMAFHETTGRRIVEVFDDRGEFIGAIYPTQDGSNCIHLVSKYFADDNFKPSKRHDPGAGRAREVQGQVMIDVVFPDNENCPDCGGFIFRPGPCGGISQNVECVGCLSRFNVARWDPAMHVREVQAIYKQPLPIVWAQRIPSEADGGGEWREDMFPKVCQ